ncbi:MAG: peptidoglycan-associated lipoprotein Pal [Deltaproteobacteria bacterium]
MVPKCQVTFQGLDRIRVPKFLFSRNIMLAVTVSLALIAFTSGCARKIVKPNPPAVSGAGVQPRGPVAEHDLQSVQAELKAVYFDYDKFTLTPSAQAALQYDADILKRTPNVKIVAEGHCDERGTDEYNLALGERRARSVVGYLASLGIPSDRMSTVSYGSELPVDPAHNEAAWAKNRRVYLRVSK